MTDRERLLDLADALGASPADGDTLTFRRDGRASWRLDWIPADVSGPLVARWSARASRSFEAIEDVARDVLAQEGQGLQLARTSPAQGYRVLNTDAPSPAIAAGGNAVPPALAEAIGRAILTAHLQEPTP